MTRFLEVADAEVVSDTHRQAVGKQMSHAQREHGHLAERSSRDAGNDRNVVTTPSFAPQTRSRM